MSKKTTENTMNELHGLVGESIIKLLKEEKTAANITLAMKFLKDNNITADPEHNKSLEEVSKAFDDAKIAIKTLPFPTAFSN